MSALWGLVEILYLELKVLRMQTECVSKCFHFKCLYLAGLRKQFESGAAMEDQNTAGALRISRFGNPKIV